MNMYICSNMHLNKNKKTKQKEKTDYPTKKERKKISINNKK